MLFDSHRHKRLSPIAETLTKVERFALHLHLAVFDLAEIKDLIDQTQQQARIFLDDLQEFAVGIGNGRRGKELVDRVGYECQRRAKVVPTVS